MTGSWRLAGLVWRWVVAGSRGVAGERAGGHGLLPSITGDAWWTFGRKPISESEIEREIDRQAGQRR